MKFFHRTNFLKLDLLTYQRGMLISDLNKLYTPSGGHMDVNYFKHDVSEDSMTIKEERCRSMCAKTVNSRELDSNPLFENWFFSPPH